MAALRSRNPVPPEPLNTEPLRRVNRPSNVAAAQRVLEGAITGDTGEERDILHAFETLYDKKPAQARNLLLEIISLRLGNNCCVDSEIKALFGRETGEPKEDMKALTLLQYNPGRFTRAKTKLATIEILKVQCVRNLRCAEMQLGDIEALADVVKSTASLQVQQAAVDRLLSCSMVPEICGRQSLALVKAALTILQLLNPDSNTVATLKVALAPHAVELNSEISTLTAQIPQLLRLRQLLENKSSPGQKTPHVLAESRDWVSLCTSLESFRSDKFPATVLKLLNRALCDTSTSNTLKLKDLKDMFRVYKILSQYGSCGPQLKHSISNALFNLGKRVRPDPSYLDIWLLSLALETSLGPSQKLLDKTSRILVGLGQQSLDFEEIQVALYQLLQSIPGDALDVLRGGLETEWCSLIASLNEFVKSRSLVRYFVDKPNGMCFLLYAYSVPATVSEAAQEDATKILGILASDHTLSPDINAQISVLYYDICGHFYPSTHLLELLPACSPVMQLALLRILVTQHSFAGLAYEWCSKLCHTVENDEYLPMLHSIVHFAGFCDLEVELQESMKHLALSWQDRFAAQINRVIEDPHSSKLADLLKIKKDFTSESLHDNQGALLINSLLQMAYGEFLVRSGHVSEAISALSCILTTIQKEASKPACQLEYQALYMDVTFRLSQFYQFMGSAHDASLYLEESLKRAQKFGSAARLSAYQKFRADLRSAMGEESETASEDMASESVDALGESLKIKLSQCALSPVDLSKPVSRYASVLKQLSSDLVLSLLPNSIRAVPTFGKNFDCLPSDSLQKNCTGHLQELLRVLQKVEVSKGSWADLKTYACLFGNTLSYLAMITVINAFPSITCALEESKFSFVEKSLSVNTAAGLFNRLALTQQDATEDNKELKVPRGVVAVSINLSSTGQLVLARREENGEEVIVMLPLDRVSSGTVETLAFEEGLDTLQKIISGSREHAVFSPNSPEAQDSDRAKRWWKAQCEYDRQLEELLKRIEKEWLGGFKGVFYPHSLKDDPELTCLKNRIEAILLKHLSSVSSGRKIKSIDVNIEYVELFGSLLHLQPKITEDEAEDLVTFIIDGLRFQGHIVDYEELDLPELLHDVVTACATYRAETTHLPFESRHLVIIPDSNFGAFPWESTNCLKSTPTTRALSMAHLDRMSQLQDVSTASVTYILNPGRDLARTQSDFEAEFRLRGWTGYAGRAPKESELLQRLQNSTCYVYVGHGAGEAYVRASSLKKLESCCPVMLLGCSSGRLKTAGQFDAFGPPTNYAIAGCPLFVGNLWDVPDKDLNRFSKEFLGRFFDDGETVSNAVMESRNACLLRYTTGAAPVVYGLPVRTQMAHRQLCGGLA